MLKRFLALSESNKVKKCMFVMRLEENWDKNLGDVIQFKMTKKTVEQKLGIRKTVANVIDV